MHKKYIIVLSLIFITILSVTMVSAEDIDGTSGSDINYGETDLNTGNIEDMNGMVNAGSEYVEDTTSPGIDDVDTNLNENINLTYDFEEQEDFEHIVSTYNSEEHNGTTTINMLLSNYDTINLSYDNQIRNLIINGNNATITGNINVDVGENSTVIINALTLTGNVSIVNNGTLHLINDSFINIEQATRLIENNNLLFIDNCLFTGINSSLLNNGDIASIDGNIDMINSAISNSAFIINRGKLLIDNTTLSDNVMTSFIYDPNDYDFFYEDTEFYKVAEVLIINSRLNNVIHYFNPFARAKQITILNSSLSNVKLEFEDSSTTIVADEIIMFDNSLSDINLSLDSEFFVSFNNYDENGLWNETDNIDEEELYSQINEYIENFLNNDVIIVYKPEQIETQITVDEIGEAVYGENITIQGQLTDINGNTLNNTPVIISSNFNVLDLTTTDDEGKYYYTFEVTKMGENIIDIEFEGYDSYKGTINSITFNVTKKASKIFVNDISDVQYTDNVTITGRYVDIDNNYLRYTPIVITVNGVKYINNTNSYGVFTLNLRTNKLGENNVTVSYPGNSRFKGANDSTTFNVTRKDTVFTLNVPSQVQYTDNITITGQYTDTNGVNLRYTPVILTINNQNHTLTTNATGEFTYTTKANIIGTNNISVLYQGNMRYNKGEENTTLEVLRKETLFTLDEISEVEYTDSVTITGRYTDTNGNNLRYTPIKLKVNNNQFVIYTDSNGQFSFVIRASEIGTNNVTVSYAGNARYAPFIGETTFEVSKKSTTFTINKISQKFYSEDVVINGTYTDINGNSLRYTPIRLTINNHAYTVTTNVYGQFSFTIKATTVGTNNITVSYPGNARYAGTSANTTFKVVPKPTNITVQLSQKQAKSNITLSGKFTDKDGLSLRYTPLIVNINGNKLTVTTDSNGNYNYSFLPTTSGTYSLTVSYNGNARYAATSTTKTFKIVKT